MIALQMLGGRSGGCLWLPQCSTQCGCPKRQTQWLMISLLLILYYSNIQLQMKPELQIQIKIQIEHLFY